MTSRKPQKPKVELLSPAGSFDALRAAVANGADAVYLGTKEFNARVNAGNFSLDDLGQAVEYCHRQGVCVYLTVNTLVKNRELRRFFDTVSRAYSLGVDGVIVQEISFLDLIKRSLPGLKVFVSTQAAISNTSAASLLKSADRIILPREMSLAEIRQFVATGIEVEVFVHGALCFSYSGLCLLSSFVANRSGNRGSCAQICRQKYNGTYPLSTKELCLVERLPDLIEAGVTGLKIEGRMRSPLYVAVTTRLYRKAIDSYLAGRFEVPRKELSEIEVVFNREFTQGFAFEDTAPLSPERPMNRGAYLGVIENGEVRLERDVALGDGVGIWHKGSVTGAVIKSIVSGGRAALIARAGELVNPGLPAPHGARVYLTSSGAITVEPGFTVRHAPIRQEKRQQVRIALPQIAGRKAGPLQLLVKAYSLAETVESARAGADAVFYDIFAPDFPNRGQWLGKVTLGAYLPRIMSEAELQQSIDLLQAKKPEVVLAGNLGFLAHRRQFEIPVYADYSLNIFNDLDFAFFERYRVVPVLSPELDIREMSEFSHKNAAILIHGDIAVMNTMIRFDVAEIADEKGLVFPVRSEGSYRQILNSRPFGVFNDIRRLRETGFRQFLIDCQGEGARFVALYRRMLESDVPDRRLRKRYTSGHLYRPVP